jgi:putative ABC transport system permease protein
VIAADSVTVAVLLLQVVTSVFIDFAVYVGAIVTAKTFATIMPVDTGMIALDRLIG